MNLSPWTLNLRACQPAGVAAILRAGLCVLATILAPVVLLAAPEPRPMKAAARPGLGELSFDADALAAIIRGGMPGPKPVEIPGIGTVTLRLLAPRTVQLVDGGLEARVAVRIEELGSDLAVRLRYEPEVLADSGRIRLRAVSATGEGALSLLPDLAGLMPAAEFPRGFDWLVPDAEHPHTKMNLYVQDVTITETLLVIRFALGARPFSAAPATPPPAKR